MKKYIVMWFIVGCVFLQAQNLQEQLNNLGNKAKQYEQKEQYREALDIYKKIIVFVDKHNADQNVKDMVLQKIYDVLNIVKEKGNSLYRERKYQDAYLYLKNFEKDAKTYLQFELACLFYNILGMSLYQISEFEEALKYCQIALDYPLVDDGKAYSYYNLGLIHKSLENWEKSKENFEKALKFRLKTNHYAEIGRCYIALGDLYCDLSDYIKIKEMYEFAKKWFDQIVDAESREYCQSFYFMSIGKYYNAVGKYEKQLELLESIENNFSDQEKAIYHGHIAKTLIDLGRYQDALSETNKVKYYVCDIQKKYGEELTKGIISDQLQKELKKKKVNISVKLYVKEVNNNKGLENNSKEWLLSDKGGSRYSLIQEGNNFKLYGKGYPPEERKNKANWHNQKGIILGYLGMYEEALDEHKKSLEIRKSIYKDNPDSYSIAESQNNIADIYVKQKKYREAFKIGEEVIKNKGLQPLRDKLATAYNNYGFYYEQQGHIYRTKGEDKLALEMYKMSLENYKKAIDIFPKMIGSTPPALANIQSNLSIAYYLLGEKTEAEIYSEQCLDTRKILFKNQLAVLSTNEKIKLSSRYFDSPHSLLLSLCCDTYIDQNLIDSAFVKAISYKGLVTRILLYEKEMQGLNSELFEKYKSLVLSVSTYNTRMLPSEPKKREEIQNYLKNLIAEKKEIEREITKELENKIGKEKFEAFQNRLFLSQNDIKNIQNKIPENAALLEFVTFTHYKENTRCLGVFIVKRTGNIEFVLLGSLEDFKRKILTIREMMDQDGSYYIQNKNNPKLLKRELSKREKQLAKETHALYSLLWSPKVKELLANTQILFIAPDESLHFLSFAILAIENDDTIKYLTEQYTVTYLTSGNSLLREYGKEGKDFYCITDPNFDLDPSEKKLNRLELSYFPEKEWVAPRSLKWNEWQKIDYGNKMDVFPRKYLQHYLGENTKIRVGDEALETNFLLDVALAPRWMHVITHGFCQDIHFVGSMEYDEQSDITEWVKENKERLVLNRIVSDIHNTEVFNIDGMCVLKNKGREYPIMKNGKFLNIYEKKSNTYSLKDIRDREFYQTGATINPLLLSGMVFSGANKIPPYKSKDDGWLSSEDIALLNFSETRCIILCSCYTGLGKYLSGEGLFGFKWAFEYAGAKNVILPVDKISRDETHRLMDEFYHLYKKDRNVWEILAEAQKSFLMTEREGRGYSHPFFWGSFICQGSVQPERKTETVESPDKDSNKQFDEKEKTDYIWYLIAGVSILSCLFFVFLRKRVITKITSKKLPRRSRIHKSRTRIKR